MKKLHMGTMSYGSDSMDEVAHQLALAFGLTAEQGNASVPCGASKLFTQLFSDGSPGSNTYWCTIRHSRPKRHVFKGERCCIEFSIMPQRELTGFC